MRKVIQPFIETSPDILAGLMDQKATPKSLTDAKLSFLRHCMANGFLDKIITATGFGKIQKNILNKLFAQLIDQLDKTAHDIPNFLKRCGITEEQFMLGQSVGLNEANQELYRAGTLTIADVLKTQPAIILKNT